MRHPHKRTATATVDTMLAAIAADVRGTRDFIGKDELDPRVMAAIAAVPRGRFVPADDAWLAYENVPLPIGSGQTISQPYIVALMTDLLAAGPAARVLEIGTGSGYQAAVLSRLVRQVYTVETVGALGEQASRTLRALGYDNISVRIGDGYGGWPEEAPFDGIVVTAAVAEAPPPLLAQLGPGARLVIPLGSPDGDQMLCVIEKDGSGEIKRRNLLPVRFVPFRRAPPPTR